MPASVTITVSDLQTSTSFFLSALQPLGMVYRCHGDNNKATGFGPTADRSAPADFWIQQETLGVPAGAAHVSFAAINKAAVDDFYIAAMKAGADFYDKPAVRDGSGYYSASVIDRDQNSIEAGFRPALSDGKTSDNRSVARSSKVSRSGSENKSQVSRAAPSEARSAVTQSSTRTSSTRKTSGNLLESIVSDTRSGLSVARDLAEGIRGHQSSQSTSTGPAGGDVIMGTLLGVAAGAALHYALTHDNKSKNRPSTIARSSTEPMASTQYGDHLQKYEPHYLALEDNDQAFDTRSHRSIASTSRNNHGDQPVYSTGFGNGSIASKATSHRPKLLTAPPPPSSFKASPSPFSRSSSSQHTKQVVAESLPPSASEMHHSSSSRHRSRRASISGSTTSTIRPYQTPLPPSTTSKQSHLTTHTATTAKNTKASHHTPSIPTSSRLPPASISKAHARRAPLSEANLARAMTSPSLPSPAATAPLPVPMAGNVPPSIAPSMSLHTANRDPDEYPVRRPRGSRTGSRATRDSKVSRFDLEVAPGDSISVVSTVR